eukprot:jgi/Hompol1/3959/HPOL_003413-RA
MINKLIAHNNAIPVTDHSLTRFHSRSPPAISISDYLVRIVRFANVELPVLLIILVYIDRICTKHAHFTISSLTAHRFIIAAVCTATKSLSDIYCTNTFYGKVGGVSLAEMNILEVELCTMMDWELACSESLLQTYFWNLARTCDTMALQFLPDNTPSLHQ